MPVRQDGFEIFKAKLIGFQETGSVLVDVLKNENEATVSDWLKRIKEPKKLFREYERILLDSLIAPEREYLCSLLFALVGPVFATTREDSPRSESEYSKSLIGFCSNFIPYLIWFSISLPSAISNESVPHEQKSLLQKISESTASTETLLIAYFQSACVFLRPQSNADRAQKIQKMLYSESIFLDKPIRQLPDNSINPNLLPHVPEHYIEDSNVLSSESNINSITPSTKSKVFEVILKLYEQTLGFYLDDGFNHDSSEPDIPITIESLIAFSLMAERLLVTGYSETPIPFEPELPNDLLTFAPPNIQKFYKLSSFLYSELNDSSGFPVIPLSPIPSTEPAANILRYSISSQPSTPNPRQTFFNDPLRPRPISSAFSGQSPIITVTNASKQMLQSALIYHHNQPDARPSSKVGKNTGLQLSPRCNLSRDTFRIMLSILHYCANYVVRNKEDNITYSSREQIPGIWKSFFSKGYSPVYAGLQEEEGLLSTSEDDDHKRKHKSAPATSSNASPAVSLAVEDLLHLLAFRSLKTLYHRAMYEQYWEVAMGARCLLVTLSKYQSTLVLK